MPPIAISTAAPDASSRGRTRPKAPRPAAPSASSAIAPTDCAASAIAKRIAAAHRHRAARDEIASHSAANALSEIHRPNWLPFSNKPSGLKPT